MRESQTSNENVRMNRNLNARLPMGLPFHQPNGNGTKSRPAGNPPVKSTGAGISSKTFLILPAEGRTRCAVNTLQGLSRHQCVDDGFFCRPCRRFEKRRDLIVRQHFHCAERLTGFAAPALAVEKQMKISPELFPAIPPVRAIPSAARLARAFS